MGGKANSELCILPRVSARSEASQDGEAAKHGRIRPEPHKGHGAWGMMNGRRRGSISFRYRGAERW